MELPLERRCGWVMAAAVAVLVPLERRGSAYGVFNATYGVAWFLGSWLMGVLYGLWLPGSWCSPWSPSSPPSRFSWRWPPLPRPASSLVRTCPSWRTRSIAPTMRSPPGRPLPLPVAMKLAVNRVGSGADGFYCTCSRATSERRQT